MRLNEWFDFLSYLLGFFMLGMVLDWLFIDCFCSLLVFLRIIEYDMLVKIK